VSMCLPALATSLVRFLGLLGGGHGRTFELQRNGFGALCFSEVCKCKMPMCNVTFIGKHKHSQSAHPNDINLKTFELTLVQFSINDSVPDRSIRQYGFIMEICRILIDSATMHRYYLFHFQLYEDRWQFCGSIKAC